MRSFQRFILFTAILCVLGGSTLVAAQNPYVVMQTNYGDMVIELYHHVAPITVNNFLAYVNTGFYNGTVFHRVIDDFMIQAGAYYTKGYTIYYKTPAYNSIINEGDNGLRNMRGTISTALGDSPNSATSQFFINYVDNLHLDHDYPDGNGYGHCVFGAVIEGMDVVDSIANINPTDICYINPSLTHFPCNPPVFIHLAYELPHMPSYCSDLSSTSEIDFANFEILASYWLDDCSSTNGFCSGADLDYSGSVDMIDLDMFWTHWLCPTGYETRFSDLAYDQTVNMYDLIWVISNWLNSDCGPDNNYCDRADINRDGRVDFIDCTLLSGSWLGSY